MGIVLFVSGAMALGHGARIALLRRRIDTPLFELSGARAVAVGVGLMVVGALALLVALRQLSGRAD
jgi:hypothetical protein